MASLSSQHPLLKLIESLPQTPYEFRVRDWVVLLFAASAAVAYLGDGKFWGKKDPNLYLMYTAPQASSEFKTKPKKTRNIAQKLEETVRTSFLIHINRH
jgi:NADPH-ferrihemoprotein reductase